MDISRVFDVEFYKRSTLLVAKDLLGTQLCRRFNDGTVLAAQIVEVEAYMANDPACHAFRGQTERCRVMFETPGRAYVYFIYGMYHCLNVVTEPAGVPGAVLIRAIGAPGGDGPGKLCRLWQIDKRHNGVDLSNSDSDIWIAKGEKVKKSEISTSTRIGLTQATELPWRFYLKDHPLVSGRKQTKKRAL